VAGVMIQPTTTKRWDNRKLLVGFILRFMDSNSCPSNRLYHAKMLDMLVVFFRVKQIEREQEEDDESRMKSKILHVFDDDDGCGVERMVLLL
jgi:hypothetical protein